MNGIMEGRAVGDDVVLAWRYGHICEVRGVDVKEHGIEKLDRLGGVDLKRVKLVSTPTIRRSGCSPRPIESRGRGPGVSGSCRPAPDI